MIDYNPDGTVMSPCLALCKLDDNKYCLGCRRHVDEIRYWPTYTEERKKEVVLESRKRLAEVKTS